MRRRQARFVMHLLKLASCGQVLLLEDQVFKSAVHKRKCQEILRTARRGLACLVRVSEGMRDRRVCVASRPTGSGFLTPDC